MRKFAAATSILLLVATILLAPVTYASADTTGTNLTTSPIVVSLSGKPGNTISTVLHVQNNNPSPVNVNVSLETFKANGLSGAAQMLPFAKSDPSNSWVHFSQNNFVAQPGAWTSITMTIALPKTAALGYYYSVIFKPQVANSAQGQATTTIKGGNAVLVLVNAVTSNEHPQIAVTNFSADKKVYQYLPANFSVTVKNTGNIYLAPSGDIYISKSSNFTSAIDTIPVNASGSGGNVLAGTSRSFTQQWADGWPVVKTKTIDGNVVTTSKGQLVTTTDWNLANASKLRFGKYYAKLVLAYNDGTRDVPIVAVVSFWVIPWKILSIFAILLVFTVVGLYVSGRKIADRTFKLTKQVKHKSYKSQD